MSISRSRPAGPLRRLLRLPIYLYRLKMGRAAGYRFLMLTHRGRKTGAVRQTVLEVIFYDPARQESFVLSGWGPRTDWYQNIKAGPALLVETGRLRYRPVQRFLSPSEVRQTWSKFRRTHPLEEKIALRLLAGRVPGTAGQKRKHLAQTLLMVAFRPEWSLARQVWSTNAGHERNK